jgi:hypothetical protein
MVGQVWAQLVAIGPRASPQQLVALHHMTAR